MMTTYSRPLFDASGNIYAIITADVSLEWLTELVTESDLDFNQRVLNIKDQERDAQWAILEGDSAFFYHHAYTYIIGKGGAYITHPLRDRILNESYFILADVTADTIDNRIGYEMIDGKTGMEAVDRDGTKFYINYAPIERTGWSMATVIPAKLIFTRSMIFGGIVVAVMLIGLAILFFICHHILIRVTKPLTLFAKSADEVAQGNLNASLPQILSHDEMKRLHDSFAMMQTSLKEQMEELKQVNETKGRIEGELNAAKDIQMSMLPKLFPAYPDRDDIDIYGQLTSAKEVGGDLFDFFIRDDKLFFCIGDVSGKGIPASLVMAMTRSLFRNIANHESRPEKIVSLINEAMSDGNDSNMFVTFFLGVLDLQTGQLHYCNAGHDWPYLVGNGITELKSDPNLPVGTFSDTVYCLEEYRMPEGTILFMYTDGLTEAQDSQNNLFGDQRIVDVLQTGGSCKEIIAKMTEAVHKFVGDAEQSDDLTMLAIQYKSTTKQ
jgi:sigma-B regulation protein RsbU (phosphoserine phosphatase)